MTRGRQFNRSQSRPRLPEMEGARDFAGSTGPQPISALVGAYFFGAGGERLNIITKELAADALQHCRPLVTALGEAVTSCDEAPDAELNVDLPEDSDSRKFRRLSHQSSRSGSSSDLLPPAVLLRFVISALGSLAVLVWSVIRYGGHGQIRRSSPIWLAAHAEWTNRTRHLLHVAPSADEPPLPLLLLGRPRSSVGQFRSLLQRHVPGARFDLIRPFSVPALFGALPAIRSELASALGTIRTTGHMPPFGRLSGILYRLCLGQVHRRWWRQVNAQPEIIVYAHTGNADTSALELQQQRSGSRTVHLFHGISTGHIFSGFSDLAITRCGHDAQWHERLGGYAKATHLAATSQLTAESAGWALFTNYAHPTAFSTEAAGVSYEVEVIATVAAAAQRLRQRTEAVAYRPHPALGSLSRQSRRRVEEAARDAGLAPWPNGRELTTAPGFELVITTPSTIIQDALCAGSVPIVIDLVGVDADSVYGAYPFRASSQEQLVELVREVQAAPEQCFKRAWEAVQPGLMPDLKRIGQMAADLGRSSQPSEEAC